jgi:hypothetical protein
VALPAFLPPIKIAKSDLNRFLGENFPFAQTKSSSTQVLSGLSVLKSILPAFVTLVRLFVNETPFEVASATFVQIIRNAVERIVHEGGTIPLPGNVNLEEDLW